jgi:hypothetical protein
MVEGPPDTCLRAFSCRGAFTAAFEVNDALNFSTVGSGGLPLPLQCPLIGGRDFQGSDGAWWSNISTFMPVVVAVATFASLLLRGGMLFFFIVFVATCACAVGEKEREATCECVCG